MKSIPIAYIKEWFKYHRDDYNYLLINRAEVQIILENLTDDWLKFGDEWKEGEEIGKQENLLGEHPYHSRRP